MYESQLTGIILSGGKSSRMGKEKGLVDFQGKPLISHAILALKPLVDNIILGANHQLNNYKKFGYTIVEDEVKNIGPLGGVLSCLQHSDTKNNIILSCDMPFVSTDLLNYLIKQKQDYDVVVPIHDTNKIEPLCGIYSKSIIPVMEDAVKEGNYKLRDIFKKVRFATVEIGPSLPFYSRRLFYNINKPEDIHL
jgi:molybdopterin-guanine dinucleotide biosynthesis protein A